MIVPAFFMALGTEGNFSGPASSVEESSSGTGLEFSGNITAGSWVDFPLSSTSGLIETPYGYFAGRDVSFFTEGKFLLTYNTGDSSFGACLGSYFDRDGLFFKDVVLFYRRDFSLYFGKVRFGNSLIDFRNAWGVGLDSDAFRVSLFRFASDTVFSRYGFYIEVGAGNDAFKLRPFMFGYTDITSGLSEIESGYQGSYVVVTTDISGVLKKSITVDLSAYPLLRVEIARVGENGSSWFIEVRRPGESFTVQPSTSSSGSFVYNVAAITGWKGVSNFEIVFGVSDNQNDILTNPVVVKSFEFVSTAGERGWDFSGFSGWEKVSVRIESFSSSEILSSGQFPYHLVPRSGLGGGILLEDSAGPFRGNVRFAASRRFVRADVNQMFSVGKLKASLESSFIKGFENYLPFFRDSFRGREMEFSSRNAYYEFPWFTGGPGGKYYGTYPVPGVNSTVFYGQGRIEYECGKVPLTSFPYLCVEVELPQKDYSSNWAIYLRTEDGNETLLYRGCDDGAFCFDVSRILGEKGGEHSITVVIKKSSSPLVLKRLFFASVPVAFTMDGFSLSMSLKYSILDDLPISLVYAAGGSSDFSRSYHILGMDASYTFPSLKSLRISVLGAFAPIGNEYDFFPEAWYRFAGSQKEFSSLLMGLPGMTFSNFDNSNFNNKDRKFYFGGVLLSFSRAMEELKSIPRFSLSATTMFSFVQGNFLMGVDGSFGMADIVSVNGKYFRGFGDHGSSKGMLGVDFGKEFVLPAGRSLRAGYSYFLYFSNLWGHRYLNDEVAYVRIRIPLSRGGVASLGVNFHSFSDAFVANADFRFSMGW